MNLKNARLLTGEIVNIAVENGRIASVTTSDVDNAYDCEGKTVIPGLIDIHTHGCMGADTMEMDFATLCDNWAKHGTTSVYPTTMTMDIPSIRKVTEADFNVPGAEILGLHMEGPYINYNKRGAQNGKFVKEADIEEFESMKHLDIITLAPECGNNMEFVKKCKAVVQIGHTECDYETAIEAINNGAICLTHSFNAMPGLLSRTPGPLGAAIEKHIYAECITDGLHVSKAAVLALYKALGSDRMIIISDSLRTTGLPDGEYMFGGQPIYMVDGICRIKEGNLAGSTSYLFDCVKSANRMGIPFDECVRMATLTPAEMMKITDRKGRIAAGCDADILVLDADLNLEKVMLKGEFYA